MKNHQIVFLILFSLLLLFYSGNSFYGDIFSYNRAIFYKSQQTIGFPTNPIPYVKPGSPDPFLTAQGVYIVDLYSFTPVFQRNPHLRLFPASTTKMLTALVASDYFKPDDILTVKDVMNEGQVVGVESGEKFTLENLLYGLLVYSGNDIAFVIADNYPGGEGEFVKKMNEKAKELHMNDSSFKNPAGLDADGQYSSAFDLALLGRQVLKNEELAKIVSTKSITISDVDFKHFYDLDNVNKLLGVIPGVGGLKTGYTEEAGENLVSFYKKGPSEFLTVVMKSDDRFADTTNIISWIDRSVAFTPLGSF